METEEGLPRPGDSGEQKGALDAVGSWSRRDTIWTDGSRLKDGRVEAACVWRAAGEWEGRCFRLGDNKEVFNAEIYAIAQALETLDRGEESGH